MTGAALAQDLASFKRDLQKVLREIQDAHKEKESVMLDIRTLRKEFDATIAVQRQYLLGLEEEKRKGLAEVERYLASRDGEKVRANSEIEALSTSLTSARSRVSTLEGREDMLQSKMKELDIILMKKRRDIDSMESRIKQLDKDIAWREALIKDVAALEGRKKSLSKYLASLAAKERMLEEWDAVLTFKKSQLDGREHMISVREQAIDSLAEKSVFLFQKSAEQANLHI